MTPLRHALRSLLATPSSTALVVVTLALGIGMSTAVFSVVEALLLRPLPFPDADRLVLVWEYHRERPDGSHGPGRNVVGPANFVRWKERVSSFEELGMFAGGHGTLSVPMSMTVSGLVLPERVPAALVTDTLFTTLGASPLIGRTIEPGDSAPGAPLVVVVSDEWWRRQLAADPGVVGQSLLVNGESATIVGVIRRAAALPHDAAVWVPLTVNDGFREGRGRWAGVVGRLAPGVRIEQARQELAAVAAALEQERPERNAGWATTVVPLAGELVGPVRPALTTVALAVGFLLVVGCLNVVNLLLVRALGRHRDVAVRMALGAQPRQIVGHALLEGGLLAGMGGTLGLLGAMAVLRVAEGPLQALLVTSATVTINTAVLAFAAGVCLLTALVLGVAPAWVATCRVRIGTLADGRSVSPGRAVSWLRSTLIVSEFALVLLMLLTAGALLRSYWALTRIDPGFDAAQVVSLRAAPAGEAYAQPASVVDYYARLLEAAAIVPGVEMAGAISFKPLGAGGAATSYEIVGRPVPPGEAPVADVRIATAGLLEALRVPLVDGRGLAHRDVADAAPVVVVNQAFVRSLPAGVEPLGLGIEFAWGSEPVTRAIVGIVGDVHLRALDSEPRPTAYLPLPQSPSRDMTLVARVRENPSAALARLRAAAAAIDPQVPITDPETLQETVAASITRPRVLSTVLGLLTAGVLLLAVIGLYGVLSHSVQQRVQEIGVRMAIGAAPRDVVTLIARDGLRLIVAGCVGGLALAAAAGTVLDRLLVPAARADLATGTAVVVLLCVVGLLATAVPAWRASRVDPVDVLRG